MAWVRLMFFKCRICSEKDLRIADLKAQIQDLRAQLIPNNKTIPDIQMEADGVLSGQQHVIEIDDALSELTEAEQIRSERDRLLSGTY